MGEPDLSLKSQSAQMFTEVGLQKEAAWFWVKFVFVVPKQHHVALVSKCLSFDLRRRLCQEQG